MQTILITPSVARAIASGGYSKQDIKDYLCKNSTVAIGEISFELKYGDGLGAGTTIAQAIELGWDTPKEWAGKGADEVVPVMVNPGAIHVIVCGDRTRNKSMALYTVSCRPVTKEIKR